MYFSTTIGALALALPALSFPKASTPPVSPGGPSIMKPINVNDFDSAFGNQRRAAEQFSSMDPQTQERLIYGLRGGNGDLTVADMTLYAEHGRQIVLMERFEGLTKSVDCKGDDGTMSLTFNSQAAFNYALKTWDFINQSEEKEFLLIANHDGCGPDDERQPYLITSIREDTRSLTTFLTAHAAKWHEVAGTYDLDFGHVLIPKTTTGYSRRSFIGGLEGNSDKTESKTFSVAVGSPNQKSSILDTGKVKIDCVNCYVTGQFTLTGHISTHHFKPKEVTLNMSPSGFAAELELSTTISGTISPDSLSYSKTLFTAPVPGAGIAVTGIFSLGATISYDIGASVSFSGSATVQYGLSASIPDTARITANLESPSDSSATGFDGGQVTPIFDVSAVSAGVTLGAYSQPKLSFGLDIIEIAKLEADFSIKLPQVSATLTGAYNPAGLCTPGGSKTGVNLTSSVGIEVDFGFDAGIGSANHNFNKKLFGIDHDLGSKCFPVNIPGLGPATTSAIAPSTVVAPPTAPANTQTVNPTSVSTAVPIPTTGPANGTAPYTLRTSVVALSTAVAPHTVPVNTNPTSVGTAVPIPTTGPANGTAPYAGRRIRLA